MPRATCLRCSGKLALASDAGDRLDGRTLIDDRKQRAGFADGLRTPSVDRFGTPPIGLGIWSRSWCGAIASGWLWSGGWLGDAGEGCGREEVRERERDFGLQEARFGQQSTPKGRKRRPVSFMYCKIVPIYCIRAAAAAALGCACVVCACVACSPGLAALEDGVRLGLDRDAMAWVCRTDG